MRTTILIVAGPKEIGTGSNVFSTVPKKRSERDMHYLYGIKRDGPPRLIATFTSEQQLLAYVRWATLESHAPQHGKFEQGSALASYNSWESSVEPLTAEDPTGVLHNPTPSML